MMLSNGRRGVSCIDEDARRRAGVLAHDAPLSNAL